MERTKNNNTNPPKKLVIFEMNLLLRRIKDEFPEIEWKNYRYVTHGWDHLVIILDGKIVFRTPKDSRYKNKLKYEIELLSYLKKKVKVGIPEYNYVSKDRSLAGYNMLMGCELSASRFRRLNSDEKEIVAKLLAEFVTILHETPKSVIEKLHVESDDQQKLYKQLVNSTKKYLYPRLCKTDIQLIERYFSELSDTLYHNFANTLVHNDLITEHILWDAKNRQINIFDFSDRTLGDPAGDFAGFLEYGLKFTRHIFDLYGSKKDDCMLERSQLYFKRISLYAMKDALLGFPCTFEQGYKIFKKRFSTKY
jgi:aminoglycoside 2''-phosphotransferase